MYVTMQCKCASIPDTHYIVTLWVHLMFFLNKNESTKKNLTAKFFLWLMVKIFIIEIISLIRPKMTSRDQDLSFDTNNVMIGQKKIS